MYYSLLFNINCTIFYVIDAIEGVYVGNANDAKDTNEQDGQKATLQKLYRYDTKNEDCWANSVRQIRYNHTDGNPER